MNTRMSLARLHKLIILGFLASLRSHAAEYTFETVGHVMTIGSASSRRTYQMELVRECIRPGESLPAESDPEGNWGTVSDDRQLSIWLPKREYAIGEPVIASVLLRNIGDRTLLDAPRNPEPLLIAGQTNQFLPRKDGLPPDSPTPYNIEDIGPRVGWTLKPGWQRKYKVLVSDIYNFSTPGEYHITAKRFFLRTNETWGEVISGTATFRVTTRALGADPNQPDKTGVASDAQNRVETTSPDRRTPPIPPAQAATTSVSPPTGEQSGNGKTDLVTLPTEKTPPQAEMPHEQLATSVVPPDRNQTSRLILFACIPIVVVIAFLVFRVTKRRQ